jgi:hypothetical protein
MTVEEAAAIMHIAPPKDPEMARYLVQVMEASMTRDADYTREQWRANREMWKLFADPDAEFVN